MAQKVSLVFKENPGALPAEYEFGAAEDVELSSVVARFNGAAAAGAFLPTLEVLAQDGALIARVRPDQEFAVGDTGVVTFAPFLRRAAAAAAVGATVSFAIFSVDNFAVAAAGSNVDFASVDDSFDVGNHFDLTAGGDAEINDAGVYGLLWTFGGEVLNANVNTELTVDINVISGSIGKWSSKLQGADEAFGVFALRIDDAASVSVLAGGDETISAFAAWQSTNTFPVVIQTFVAYTEDNVGVAKTPDIRLTIVRFGAPDV